MSSPSSSGTGPPGGASDEVDPLVGTKLADRYRLDALLGEGGMGKVYAAEHVLMRKRLAVKVLHRELTAVPEVVARFEREAMAAANIDHPNVAAATDFGKLPDGSVFLVLEFVQGRNLRDEIAQGPMHVERALLIARQIGAALSAAHSLDIVHRDLKPENVMLIEKGGDPDFVKVLDFGIAKVPIGEKTGDAEGKPITKVGMVFGTPEYMAPEQALGQVVDGRADIYALGVILYELLAGIRPFASKSPVGILGQQLSKLPPPVAERVPGLFVPPAVENLVQKLLAREADERVSTAGEAVAIIETLLGHVPGAGARLFTMAAGSPASQPGFPRVGSIPDLEEPVPVLMPPDLAARMPHASSPDGALGSSPSHVAIHELSGSSPAIQTLPDAAPGMASSPGSIPGIESSPDLGSSPGSIPGMASSPGSIPGVASSPDPLEADLDDYAPRSVASGVRPVSAEPARFKAALDDLVLRGRRTYESTLDWIDARRAQLPPNVREPLQKVPTPAFLLAAGVLVLGGALVVLIIVGALVSSSGRGATTAGSATPSASAPASSAIPAVPVGGASEQELARAREGGEPALVLLSERYPKDTVVLIALAKQRLRDKKHVEAVESVSRALAVDPGVSGDPEVASALWATSQAKDSTDAAFALLEGPMGTRGADLIYDLATTSGIRAAVKLRADKWLTSEVFQKQSSPALNALVALQKSTTCRQRYGLLKRAKNVGDARVLEVLKSYQKKTGCGKRGNEDCYTCMRADDLLVQTIRGLEERLKRK